MKKTKNTGTWVHVHPLDQKEPATEITQTSVLAFRNGLKKFAESNKDYQNNMAGTVVFRAVIDLDHLARIMENNSSRLSFRYVITAQDKASAKKRVATLKKRK